MDRELLKLWPFSNENETVWLMDRGRVSEREAKSRTDACVDLLPTRGALGYFLHQARILN